MRFTRNAIVFAILLTLAILPSAPAPAQQAAPTSPPAAKLASSRGGMVAASTPYATAAGVEILEAGGNAIDAAAAATFALMVTDPAMTSVGGRVQMLIVLHDGRAIGFDGATQQPTGVPPLAGDKDDRAGYRVVPVPGSPATLAAAVKAHGRLPLGRVLQPAIRLAEEGFVVTPRVGEIWEEERARLAQNPGARGNYLKPDGGAYKSGEHFRHPRLARVLQELAKDTQTVYRGALAEKIAGDVAANGGYLRREDLRSYQPQPGMLVRTKYRGYEILTLGRHAWGNTLVEMLNILNHFSVSRGQPTTEEVELIARVIAQAMQDRPQILGSLAPKPGGLSLDEISSQEFARERAARIREQMSRTPATPATPNLKRDAAEVLLLGDAHDTTHLSVMDSQGNAVALTTSIGPRFGSGVATPELGFLYAHSYRMRSSPEPRARDYTEMTPTIVLREGKPWLVLGAAGSERIPGAILQVIVGVVDRGWPLDRAVAEPRVFSSDAKRVRVHDDAPSAILDALRARGFELQVVPRGITRHVGIVHAAMRDPASGEFTGAADPVYDGAAAGPRLAAAPKGRSN